MRRSPLALRDRNATPRGSVPNGANDSCQSGKFSHILCRVEDIDPTPPNKTLSTLISLIGSGKAKREVSEVELGDHVVVPLRVLSPEVFHQSLAFADQNLHLC